MDGLTTVILAAGEGKRMRSRTPKVLHELCGRPLISYPLRLAQTLSDRVVMVVGPKAADVPLLLLETLERLVEHHRASGAAATVLTAIAERPQGYGRVLRQGGRVT